MNGPEHYRRAEALLESCRIPGSDDYDPDLGVVESYTPSLDDIGTGEDPEVVGEIHPPQMDGVGVHATLAVAAAQAQQTQSSMFTAREEWYPIVGHECPEEGCSNQVYDTYGRTTARCAAHEPF
jgi:hypothetical protein